MSESDGFRPGVLLVSGIGMVALHHHAGFESAVVIGIALLLWSVVRIHESVDGGSDE